MSSEAMKWAKRQKIANQPMKAVVRELACYADRAGACFPSQATLAADTGLSERCVRYCLADLERLGVIHRKARSKGRAGRSTDLIVISLHRDFEISKTDIDRSRTRPAHAPSTGTPCRLQTDLQPARRSFATGTACQGITKGTIRYPIQERVRSSTFQDVAQDGREVSTGIWPSWPEDAPFGVGRA